MEYPIYFDDQFDKKFLRYSSTSNCTQNTSKVHKYDNPKYSIITIAQELYPKQYILQIDLSYADT